jgi:predicted Ser/Thr protein kinase
MSKLELNKKFISTHIDKKFTSTKLLDLDKIEKLYKKTLSYIRGLSKKKHNEFMQSLSKHKIDIDKIKILKNIFRKIDNKKTKNKKSNNEIEDDFKKFEPKIEGEYRCFGDYKVLHGLGSGSFGVVYLVEKNGKKYAIKVISINFDPIFGMTSGNNLKNIKNEIEITKKMGEMNIGPKLYDSYICEPNINKLSAFIVMEWMTEGSLGNWLQNNKLSKKQHESILQKIEKMHKLGYIHADLHDNNILVTKNKSKVEFFIGDFGLSKTTKDLIKLQEEFDIRPIQMINKNNSILHSDIAKLFIICELI